MSKVICCVETIETAKRRLAAAFEGVAQEPRIAFTSYEQMYRILTPKRLELLRALPGQGPLGVREVARRVDRSPGNVHADIDALAKAGIVDRVNGDVEFPYDDAQFDLALSSAVALPSAA